MARKIIIDCDPGIDDAIALTMALFDPRLEVLGVTACGGTVPAETSIQNIQALVERLDPPRHPRLATTTDSEDAPTEDGQLLHGEDGLGNIGLTPVGRQHVLGSDKLIAEQVRKYPGEVTILCFGPLTGIARAFRRDPTLLKEVDRIVIVGGALKASGDVTAAAEFNMHFDPLAAQAVLKSPITKTIVPLDVVHKLNFGLDFIDRMPDKFSAIGRLLHPMTTHLSRAFRQHRASESMLLPAVVGLLFVTNPELFETEEISVEVEVNDGLTRGVTIVDRRSYQTARRDIEAVIAVDRAAARDSVINSLKFASQSSDGV
jgi:inosine-uridine nucleoside N-ribohydrolase